MEEIINYFYRKKHLLWAQIASSDTQLAGRYIFGITLTK